MQVVATPLSLVRNEEAGGSNPPSSTTFQRTCNIFRKQTILFFSSKSRAEERSDCGSALYLRSASLATRRPRVRIPPRPPDNHQCLCGFLNGQEKRDARRSHNDPSLGDSLFLSADP